MIREREDIKQEIRENPKLLEKYREWDEEQQNSLANVEVRKIGVQISGIEKCLLFLGFTVAAV